ncbi:MAG: TolC family protein [Ignavibacteria bacterium]|nr:TolC family protein [Ignavibacteria bacterium]
MNTRWKVIPVALLILVAQAGLRSQEWSLTVEESIRIGLENSKALHGSRMRAEYADAKASEVAASLYPSVRVQGAYQKLSSVPEFKIPLPGNLVTFPVVLNTYSARATLQQPLFTGWKLQAAADNASYQAEAAFHDLAKERGELIYNIKAAYWGVYRAKEMKRLADENVSRIQAHLADIENLLTQGMATKNDVMKVQVQLSSARIIQSDAGNSVRIAMLGFNSTIGLPLDSEITIKSSLTPTTRDFPDVESLVGTAFSQRPELAGMEWRLKATDASVTAAQGSWLPQLYVTGNYYYARPNPRIFPAKDEFRDTWDIGISLQFDLWNNLTSLHQTNAAKAQHEQTKDALATLKDRITLEVTQSYFTFNQAKRRISLAELGVEQASENYRGTAEKFKAGLTTNSELLDAEVALLQAKVQLTQALVEYELAEASLEKAIGQKR